MNTYRAMKWLYELEAKVRLPSWGKNDYIHVVDGVMLDNNGNDYKFLEITDCWEEYKQYNFTEAVDLMGKGKVMHRTSWGDDWSLQCLNGAFTFFYQGCSEESKPLIIEDVKATDWGVSE